MCFRITIENYVAELLRMRCGETLNILNCGGGLYLCADKSLARPGRKKKIGSVVWSVSMDVDKERRKSCANF